MKCNNKQQVDLRVVEFIVFIVSVNIRKENKDEVLNSMKKKCGKEIAMGTSVPLLIPLGGTGGIEVAGRDSRCKDKIQKQIHLCFVA